MGTRVGSLHIFFNLALKAMHFGAHRIFVESAVSLCSIEHTVVVHRRNYPSSGLYCTETFPAV